MTQEVVRVYTEKVNPDAAWNAFKFCSQSHRDYNRLRFIAENMDENGCYQVQYTRTTAKYWRISAVDGLQKLTKENRERLTARVCVDIDVVNCHPTVLANLALRHDIKCPLLELYVRSRDDLMKSIMDVTPGLDRMTLKRLFLISMYLGNYRNHTTITVYLLYELRIEMRRLKPVVITM